MISKRSTRYCNLITELIFPNTAKILENVSVTVLYGIKKLVFPASIEIIGDLTDTFKFCEEVVFEKNSKLKYVGTGFLRGCYYLKSVALPPTLSFINDWHCFEGNANLSSIIYLGRANFGNLSPFLDFGKCVVYVSYLYPAATFSNIPVTMISYICDDICTEKISYFMKIQLLFNIIVCIE